LAFYNQEYDHSTFSYWLGEPKDAFNVFAAGYRSAAEHLTESLLTRPNFAGFQAYPVVFLYCHALELSLKHAIYKAAEFAGFTGYSEIEDRLHNSHKLRPLADALERSLKLLFPRDAFLQDLMRRVRSTARDLAYIDEGSYAFRYPIDTKGQPAAQSSSINLRAFAQHMSTLLEDIDTLNFGLNAETYVAQEAFTECVLSGLAG
jgi:hypothetical protein